MRTFPGQQVQGEIPRGDEGHYAHWLSLGDVHRFEVVAVGGEVALVTEMK